MPPARVQTSVTLFGSPPWGFRLAGGKEFNQPLVISRVTPGSTAAKSGVASGDVVIAVNGQFAADMTQDECETKVKQAVGSLYLVLEKNAANINVQASGEVTVEGDRSVYDDETSFYEKLSRHNRSAKPFPGSFTASTPAASSNDSKEVSPPGKPAGFRSVTFRPKTTTSSSPSDASSSTTRSQPDGGANDEKVTSSFNNKPRQFVPYSSSSGSDNLPPPPSDFAAPSGGSSQPPSSNNSRIVQGPNQAVGLYSNANVQQSYQAQVGGN